MYLSNDNGAEALSFDAIDALPDAEFMQRFSVPTPFRSLGQIAAAAGCRVEALPAFTAETAERLLKGREAEDTLVDDIDAIYNLRHALNQEDLVDSSGLADLRGNLASFDAFLAAYAPNPRRHIMQRMATRAGDFIDNRVGEIRRMWVWGGRTQHADYMTRDTWQRVGPAGNRRQFITQAVIDEALSLDPAFADGQVFHASGSAALPGIAEHRAILSAQEALRRGTQIKSGEHVKWGRFEAGTGLYTIFGNDNPSTSYMLTRWFDEYGVALGVNKERLRQHAASRGITGLHLDDHPDGEGLWLGPEVPLHTVDTAYAFKLRLPEFESWIREHCPWVSLISIEAATEHKKIRRAHEQGALGEPVVIN